MRMTCLVHWIIHDLITLTISSTGRAGPLITKLLLFDFLQFCVCGHAKLQPKGLQLHLLRPTCSESGCLLAFQSPSQQGGKLLPSHSILTPFHPNRRAQPRLHNLCASLTPRLENSGKVFSRQRAWKTNIPLQVGVKSLRKPMIVFNCEYFRADDVQPSLAFPMIWIVIWIKVQ
jgi:hypothetical protein